MNKVNSNYSDTEILTPARKVRQNAWKSSNPGSLSPQDKLVYDLAKSKGSSIPNPGRQIQRSIWNYQSSCWCYYFRKSMSSKL